MSALARLQRDFLASVLGNGPLADDGLATYRRTAFDNWHGALAGAYPVVRRLVGDAFFREAARRYGEAEPSTSGDLHLYGASFPAFLAAYPFARELPYVPDTARLEWACHESFHAADVPAFDASVLAGVPAARYGELRFGLHPSVRRVASPHPVMAIFEANQPDRDGTPEAVGAERVLVWREGERVRLRRLDETQWSFVNAISRGERLEDAVDARAADDAAFLAPLLASLVADGVIAGFESDECAA